MDTGDLSETSRVLRALADDTRRAILVLLRSGGHPVGRLAENFAMSRPAVSKHLRLLRQAGLVSETRQGRERIYELEGERVDEAAAWLAELAEGRPPAGDAAAAAPLRPIRAPESREPGRRRRRQQKRRAPRPAPPAPESDWRCW